MTTFLFEHSVITTIEEATFADAVYQAQWLHPNDPQVYDYMPAKNGKLVRHTIERDGIAHVVPVGSVKFLTDFCKQHGIPAPTAMNVPPELDDPRFLGRKVWRNMDAGSVRGITEPGRQYLIKPGVHMKRFPITLYKPGANDNILSAFPEDEPLFISEAIDEKWLSEWRLFVCRGAIIEAKPYYMEEWSVPDYDLCKEMSEKLKGHPAVTLDVGVLASGATVVVEVHPFLSCGLYGFEGPSVLKMAKLAWAAQCNL